MKYLLIFVLLPVSCFAQKVKYLSSVKKDFYYDDIRSYIHYYYSDTINFNKYKNSSYIFYIIKDSAINGCNSRLDLHFKKTSIPLHILIFSSKVYLNYSTASPDLRVNICYFDDQINIPIQKSNIVYRQRIGNVRFLVPYKKKQIEVELIIFIEKLPQTTDANNDK